MKNTGVVRRLDELGRITLPMELRKSFNIQERDPLQIYVEDDMIILQKYTPSDIFNGSDNDLIDYCGKKVSKDSIKELANLAGFKIVEE
ncbi:MAG TPA: AbrB/MazE/SpoVT family DNA-binding domain-containing protein [Candidatus Merdenecus merdavium]|nr:AbrB/MazE/SpoVT family DNA-binding domain-containing protein [Candidatus Merdenecus merdavium]